MKNEKSKKGTGGKKRLDHLQSKKCAGEQCKKRAKGAKKRARLSRITALVAAWAILGYGALFSLTPSRFTVMEGEGCKSPYFALETDADTAVLKQQVSSREYTARLKLLGLLPIKTVAVDVIERQDLVLGGQPFGIKLYTEGVIVVGSSSMLVGGKNRNPAAEAGIKVGDRLLSVSGEKLISNEQLAAIVGGKSDPLTFEVVRGNHRFTATATPVLPDGEGVYRLGLWVRDSTAGIGTVTYYNRTTGRVAGLGHSVEDIDTGQLMPSGSGSLVSAEIDDIVKGARGETGELIGSFGERELGRLAANTEQGVFADTNSFPQERSVSISLRADIRTGPAKILTTLSGETPKWYDIEIIKLYNNLSENKNMLLQVTDPTLLQKTGGIVQGMSGSPIVQEGKLVGAVTHVLVDDPTKGYGILIEKMLLAEQELE